MTKYRYCCTIDETGKRRWETDYYQLKGDTEWEEDSRRWDEVEAMGIGGKFYFVELEVDDDP